MRGGADNDELYGDDGQDTLKGGMGADTLDGGAGTDVLTGKGGDDVFLFSSLADTGTAVATADVITDFGDGNDVIDLVALGLSGFIGYGAFTGSAGEIRAVVDGANTNLEIDSTGDGNANRFIVLENLSDTLTVSDFLLV